MQDASCGRTVQGSTEPDHGRDDKVDRSRSRTSTKSASDDEDGGGKRKFSAVQSDQSSHKAANCPAASSSRELTDRIKRPKINFGMLVTGSATSSSGASKAPISAPISIKLGAHKPKEQARTNVSLLKKSVFSVDDDEEEEMPPEARMRMRNVGRDTPTSTGPNSFGKTSKGFCDTRGSFEKELKKPSRGHNPGHK